MIHADERPCPVTVRVYHLVPSAVSNSRWPSLQRERHRSLKEIAFLDRWEPGDGLQGTRLAPSETGVGRTP